MQLIYEGNALKSGIYVIFNNHTWRIYVGQAKEFKERWRSHRSSLENNRHQNKFLLNDYRKCKEELGHDDFLEFHVLEVMPDSSKEQRNLREEHWIGIHWDKGQQCYNFKQKTKAGERGCWSSTPEETRRLISENSKEMWANPEKREKMIKAHKESPAVKEAMKKALDVLWNGEGNEERREQMALRSKERMSIPEHKEKAIQGLANGHAGSRASFRKRMQEDVEFRERYVSSGKVKTEKNNKRYQEDSEYREAMDAHSLKNIREYNAQRELQVKPAVISPDGEVFDDIRNANEFAKEHELDSSSFYKLFAGKLKSVHGWKLYLAI